MCRAGIVEKPLHFSTYGSGMEGCSGHGEFGGRCALRSWLTWKIKKLSAARNMRDGLRVSSLHWLVHSEEKERTTPTSTTVATSINKIRGAALWDAPFEFSGKRLVPSGPRRACPVSGRSAGRVPCRDSEPGRDQVVVAQRVEHQAHNLGVTGSIPVHNTPRSAEDRLLRDAENVSTTGPEGNGRPRRSALVRTEASSATRRPGGRNANGRPEARGFRRPSPTARGRRRGACRGVSASRRRLPKRTGPVGRVGSSGAPRPDA